VSKFWFQYRNFSKSVKIVQFKCNKITLNNNQFLKYDLWCIDSILGKLSIKIIENIREYFSKTKISIINLINEYQLIDTIPLSEWSDDRVSHVNWYLNIDRFDVHRMENHTSSIYQSIISALIIPGTNPLADSNWPKEKLQNRR